MSENLAPSPPPPDPYREGSEGAVFTPRTYTLSRFHSFLNCGEQVIRAGRLERFCTVSVERKVTTPHPDDPNRRTYGYPGGPRQAEWQLWGWDRFTNLLVLLDHRQGDLGGAVDSSARLGLPTTVAAWAVDDHRPYFEDPAFPLRCVRVPLFQLREATWVRDYLGDSIVWVREGTDSTGEMFADAMALAIAETESRWTDRADIYLTNPAPDEDDIPAVATCPPWWKRLLVHWAMGWPGRVAVWYLAMWYAPNLFWSSVIFTPFIQWGFRLHRRLKWQKINQKLFEARTHIMVAQAELSGRMSLFQLMAGDLPGDEAKSQRSRLLAEQNALALASQSLGIVERNFYVRHPIYARKHSALFH